MLAVESPTTPARWPVVRIEAGHQTRVQLLSGDFVRLVTHYWKRTFLCPEVEECGACRLLPARPYWYLPATNLQTARPGILELSAHASADLEQKVKFAGLALRPGVQVELSRRTKKAPLRIEIVGSQETPPQARLQEWLTPLMLLYKLPSPRPSESLQEYGERMKPYVLERANLVAGELRSAAVGYHKSRVHTQ